MTIEGYLVRGGLAGLAQKGNVQLYLTEEKNGRLIRSIFFQQNA